jgi:hypothetical protein
MLFAFLLLLVLPLAAADFCVFPCWFVVVAVILVLIVFCWHSLLLLLSALGQLLPAIIVYYCWCCR